MHSSSYAPRKREGYSAALRESLRPSPPLSATTPLRPESTPSQCRVHSRCVRRSRWARLGPPLQRAACRHTRLWIRSLWCLGTTPALCLSSAWSHRWSSGPRTCSVWPSTRRRPGSLRRTCCSPRGITTRSSRGPQVRVFFLFFY